MRLQALKKHVKENDVSILFYKSVPQVRYTFVTAIKMLASNSRRCLYYKIDSAHLCFWRVGKIALSTVTLFSNL